MVDLSVKYMGFKLRSPLILGSCALTKDIDKLKQAEEAGFGAVVLKSIFEEEIRNEVNAVVDDETALMYRQAYDYMTQYQEMASSSKYLDLIKNATEKLSIPVIASVNCATPSGWTKYAKMIQDAGGHNPWASDVHSGSVSLPFESVLEKAGEADIWLFRYSSDHEITYDELLSEHHGYNQFKAFRNQQVYGCNVELSPFYEETPFHPDWLLNDFIRILQPELDGLAPLRYYKKL